MSFARQRGFEHSTYMVHKAGPARRCRNALLLVGEKQLTSSTGALQGGGGRKGKPSPDCGQEKPHKAKEWDRLSPPAPGPEQSRDALP